jgi:serine/threonine protein kinase/Flp pilus assembly protein TadD
MREAQAASQLNHPNIVSIFAIEQDDGRDFIAMEYVAGKSLREVISEGDLSMDKSMDIAHQIGKALASAHEIGIVHRDIKSENVLVTSKGEAKILDFGLAKLRGSAKITGEGSTLGTMAYMSPEQTQGLDVDHRSDLFSFGVILYEMITGKLPFKGEHSAALTYAIVNETPEPMARYKTGVSDELQRIVDKALRKERDHRYQSAADMLADLGPVSSGSLPVYPVKRRRSNTGMIIGAVAVIAIIIAASLFLYQRRAPGPQTAVGPQRLMLAVLPFDNLGAPEDEYFADGITEEITTHLAKLSGLGVISRTSAMQYKKTTKSLREIASELNVDYILEGTIRWDKSGNKVRINPQLIKVTDDTHLWADTYDRVFDEIFSVQTDIAEEVATALNVALLERGKKSAANVRPTESMEAYQYFLQGRDYYNQVGLPENRELAVQMLENAVQADSTFADAHAWLAKTYANDYFNNRSPDEPRLEQAKVAAERAVRYARGGPQGHYAMGYYHYYCARDYDRALSEFAAALEARPNDTELLEAMGYVLRRQGRWKECVEKLGRACELDPRAHSRTSEYAQTLMHMRRWDEMQSVIDRGLTLAPDYWVFHVWKAFCSLVVDKDFEKADGLLDVAENYGPKAYVDMQREMLDFLKGDFEAALSRRPTMSTFIPPDSADYYLTKATYIYFLGDSVRARAYAHSAVSLFGRDVIARPEEPELAQNLSIAYALLGKKSEAIRWAEKSVEIMPVSRDAVMGPGMIGGLAQIYALMGERDLAFEKLEYLQTIPSLVTSVFVEYDPYLDSLKDDPRFEQLLQKSESAAF